MGSDLAVPRLPQAVWPIPIYEGPREECRTEGVPNRADAGDLPGCAGSLRSTMGLTGHPTELRTRDTAFPSVSTRFRLPAAPTQAAPTTAMSRTPAGSVQLNSIAF